MDETWLPAPGFEGHYEISSEGRVKSHKRGRTRLLRPAPNPQGYLVAYLSLDAVLHRLTMHSLVAAAFIGPRPAGQDVRHMDGTRDNNRASNLQYGTRSENTYDAVEHGTHPQARKTHCKHGHELSDQNTYSHPSVAGRRVCKVCARASLRRSRERQRLVLAGLGQVV